MTPSKDLAEAAMRLADFARSPAFDTLSDEKKSEVVRTMREVTKRGVKSKYEMLFPDDGPLRRELYPRQLEFFRAGREYLERCFMAANRVGKSTVGAFELTAHLTGVYPDWWDGRTFDEPVRTWACGKNNEKLKEIAQYELFGGVQRASGGRYAIRGSGMIPPDRILHDTAIFKTNVPGVVSEVRIRYKDSLSETSEVALKAYEQKRSAFEGTAQHVIWADEEPPLDIYSEMMMRLATLDGIMMLTFTPVAGHTEVVESFLMGDERPDDVVPAWLKDEEEEG